MSHDYHPLATERRVLSASCDECVEKRIHGLDQAHRDNLGLTNSVCLAIRDGYPQVYEALLSARAFPIQRFYIEQMKPVGWELLYEAMWQKND